MTAVLIARPAPLPVSYAEWSYTMTDASFPDGYFAVIDAHTGLVTATGANRGGRTVTAPLGVPLCQGCDEPIIDHQCTDCELVFTGEPA